MAPDSRMFSCRNLIAYSSRFSGRADRHPAAAGVARVLLAAGGAVGVVELRLAPADDRVAGLLLAEVDPGLLQAERAGRRDVAFGEGRRAGIGLRGTRPGRDHAEAVRVDQVRVDPVGLAGRRAVHVPHADYLVLRNGRAGLRVPVHGQHAGELVVALDLLELLEGLRHHGRVHQPDVGQVADQPAEVCCGQAGAGLVGLAPDVADAVRQAGVLDLPADVRALLDLLVRLDHELLDDRRVHAADQHRGQHQQAEADGGQQRIAADRAGEEENRAQHGDDRQDGLGRKDRVDIGIRSAGADHSALGEVDAVPVHEVGGRLEQDEHADQHKQVSPGRRCRALALHLRPHCPVQVVHDHRHDQRDQHRGEQVGQHHPQERVDEHEERQVQVELRVRACGTRSGWRTAARSARNSPRTAR